MIIKTEHNLYKKMVLGDYNLKLAACKNPSWLVPGSGDGGVPCSRHGRRHHESSFRPW